MKIVVFNYDTHEEIGTMKTKRLKSLFDFTQILSAEQQKKDFLGLGYTCPVMSSGIASYVTKGFVMSNDENIFESSSTVYRGKNEVICGPEAGKSLSADKRIPSPVKVIRDGQTEETNLRLLVTAYEEGFILNVGKTASNLFGVRQQMYLGNIGTRKFYCRARGTCKIFPTMKSVFEYLEKHRETLKFMVGKGYKFSVESACPAFEIPETTQNKDYVGKVYLLLDEINSCDNNQDDECPELTGIASEDEMRREAIGRLIEDFDVAKSTVNDFRKGKLYMSEFIGFLYDLNEDAEKAVVEVKEAGHMPYAVVRTQTEIGDMYAVLYVSANKEDWPHERPDRDGVCGAYVYNAGSPMCSEYGDVQVQGENGGIVRYA